MVNDIAQMRALAHEFEQEYVRMLKDAVITADDPELARRRAHRFLAASAALEMLADDIENYGTGAAQK
jgi:hypothetical protein